jgi:toxic protein SymE
MSVRPKTFYPYMKIGGMWLVNDAGFEPGEKVRIAIEPGRLVITAMWTPPRRCTSMRFVEGASADRLVAEQLHPAQDRR